MESVYELFYGEKVRVIIQNNNMSEKTGKNFLQNLKITVMTFF